MKSSAADTRESARLAPHGGGRMSLLSYMTRHGMPTSPYDIAAAGQKGTPDNININSNKTHAEGEGQKGVGIASSHRMGGPLEGKMMQCSHESALASIYLDVQCVEGGRSENYYWLPVNSFLSIPIEKTSPTLKHAWLGEY